MSATPERVHEALARVLPPERRAEFAGTDGIQACPLAAPATPEEALEVLRLVRSERWVVLPAGRGSKLGWARPPARVDLVLTSTNLRGIVSYEPADGTLTARAGTPWSELIAATGARHHLSPELPDAHGSTLGGVLASGASGLDRLRHGPLRHQLLGLLALHGDGSRVKSGGRVVKNVTGYDLHRLWCGSQGTLCFLLEATLRLYPAPAEVALVRTRSANLAEGIARSHALWRAGLQPVALVLDRDADAECELALVLAGRAEAVAGELEQLRAHLATAEVLRGEPALSARALLREGERPGGRWPPFVLSTRPSRLAALMESIERATKQLGLAPRLRLHPLLASVALDFSADPSAAVSYDTECLARLAARLAALPCTLHVRGLGARTPPLVQPDAARDLARRLKQSLDPDGVFVARHDP